MTDELDKALEWADWLNGVGYEVPKIISAKKGAKTLAAAVRSLREENAELKRRAAIIDADGIK